MDNDTDNESASPEDIPSVSSARIVSSPSAGSNDDLDYVRENLASLDDWEGLPDLDSGENISERHVAPASDDDWSGLDSNDQPGADPDPTENDTAEAVDIDAGQGDSGRDNEPADEHSDHEMVVLGGDPSGPAPSETPADEEVQADETNSARQEAVDAEPQSSSDQSAWSEHDEDVPRDSEDPTLMGGPADDDPGVAAPDTPPAPQDMAPSQEPAPPQEPAPSQEPVTPLEPIEPEPIPFALEMRQVAGLTSGSSMTLPPGKSFQFSETTTSSDAQDDGSASFVLRVTDDGRVIVLPGSAPAIVNETTVEEPTFVGNGILSVGSACFAVRPIRSATSVSALERAEVVMSAPRAITVGDMTIDSGADELFSAIAETRHQVAERHRLTHPDPEELKSRLTLMDPGLWERDREHRFFGRYSVGYAVIPWQPKFDDPSRIPEELHEQVNQMSVLPWVPVTASITQGPIAIFGGRAATLAACRHAVLSLAALSAPGAARFSVVTGRDRVDDWQWTKSLPELMSPTRSDAANGTDGHADYYQLSVVDGSEHLEPAGLSLGDAGPDSGLIVLGMDRSSVPDGCATYIGISDDGRATVTNHFNEEISATPIGVTEAFAHDMATRIADILIGYG